MNVVYIVRNGEKNEELAYSLRSLANLPHQRVWIVGHKPTWVSNVEHVQGNQRGSSTELNALDNLRLATEHVEASRFIVFNDDFYVMEPIERVPSWHEGPLVERIARAAGRYAKQLRAALELLISFGMPHPTAWTLHIPVVVERHRLADTVRMLAGRSLPPEWRTVYGNYWGVPGDQAPDVKVRRRSDPLPGGPFLSTSDGTLSSVRGLLARTFPAPSPYEVAR